MNLVSVVSDFVGANFKVLTGQIELVVAEGVSLERSAVNTLICRIDPVGCVLSNPEIDNRSKRMGERPSGVSCATCAHVQYGCDLTFQTR